MPTRLDVDAVDLTEEQIAALKKRSAVDADFMHRVRPGTEVYVGGELLAGFYRLEQDTTKLLTACEGANFVLDYRTNGMRARAATFGFQPREPLRHDFCGATRMAKNEPDVFAELLAWAPIAESFYKDRRPDVYAEHSALMQEVLPCWRLPGTLFTSGILNKDTSHFYHRDYGNFPKTWNSMIVLAKDIAGGVTVVPELGCGFDPSNEACVLVFPAEAKLHGVTDIDRRTPRAYRYSIVYYSASKMCKCGTPKEELTRVRKVATERAERRGDLAQVLVAVRNGTGYRALQKSGELERIIEAAKIELTLDQRIERLKGKTSAKARQVLKRLERQRDKERGK